MTNWEDMSVTITNVCGEGATLNFGAAKIQPARLTFRGVYMTPPHGSSVLSHFRVDFDTGRMVDWWCNISLFPLGKDAPPTIPLLPPIDGTSVVQQQYSEAMSQIQAQLSLAGTDYERLEGYLGVINGGKAATDKVVVTYHKGVVLEPDGTLSDLVVFRTCFADPAIYQVEENGVASGPPR